MIRRRGCCAQRPDRRPHAECSIIRRRPRRRDFYAECEAAAASLSAPRSLHAGPHLSCLVHSVTNGLGLAFCHDCAPVLALSPLPLALGVRRHGRRQRSRDDAQNCQKSHDRHSPQAIEDRKSTLRRYPVNTNFVPDRRNRLMLLGTAGCVSLQPTATGRQ